MIVLGAIVVLLGLSLLSPADWLASSVGQGVLGVSVGALVYGVWQHERYYATIVLPDTSSDDQTPTMLMPATLLVVSQVYLIVVYSARAVSVSESWYETMSVVLAGSVIFLLLMCMFSVVLVLRRGFRRLRHQHAREQGRL